MRRCCDTQLDTLLRGILLSVILLSVILLSVILLSVIFLSVILLSDTLLSIILLSVVYAKCHIFIIHQSVVTLNVMVPYTMLASNKSNLLIKIILQNTQTLQLFKNIIKTESIYKRN
jgi:hypothetical protein